MLLLLLMLALVPGLLDAADMVPAMLGPMVFFLSAIGATLTGNLPGRPGFLVLRGVVMGVLVVEAAVPGRLPKAKAVCGLAADADADADADAVGGREGTSLGGTGGGMSRFKDGSLGFMLSGVMARVLAGRVGAAAIIMFGVPFCSMMLLYDRSETKDWKKKKKKKENVGGKKERRREWNWKPGEQAVSS